LEKGIGCTRERRKRPEPATADELLGELPARVMLDRMPTPVIGFGTDGVLTYANAACAVMLGYADVAEVLERPLCALLVGPALRSPADYLSTLRNAGTEVIDWSHAEGYPVHTMVSNPLLLRATDPLLMFTVSDVTELLWSEALRGRRP
jgi:PAS domain-containing protein